MDMGAFRRFFSKLFRRKKGRAVTAMEQGSASREASPEFLKRLAAAKGTSARQRIMAAGQAREGRSEGEKKFDADYEKIRKRLEEEDRKKKDEGKK